MSTSRTNEERRKSARIVWELVVWQLLGLTAMVAMAACGASQ